MEDAAGRNGIPAPPVAPAGMLAESTRPAVPSVALSAASAGVQDPRARRPDGKPVGRPFQKGQPNPGRGRPPGSVNGSIKDIRQLCRKMLEDKSYLQHVQKRLRRGTLPPAVWAKLYEYAYGKPVDRVRLTGGILTGDAAGLLEAWGATRRVLEHGATLALDTGDGDGNGDGV